MSAPAPSQISPSTTVGFPGGGGEPDSDFFISRARSATLRGDYLHAGVFSWLIVAFTRHVVLVGEPGGTDADDEGVRVPVRAEVGGYRIFEMAAAWEESRTARIAATQLAAACDDALVQLLDHPTYEMVAKEEIHAHMGNILCVTGFAHELDSPRWRDRWLNTVPAQVPAELSTFVDGYRSMLTETDGELPLFEDGLQLHSRELGRLFGASAADADRAAGRVHASRVMLFEIGHRR